MSATVDAVSTGPTLVTIALPIPWAELGFPEPLQLGSTAVTHGDIGWSWKGATPRFPILSCHPQRRQAVEGWNLDHVVLLVPDLEDALTTFSAIDLAPGLKVEVKGRPTAFFRVGPLLEVIESPVRAAALYGVALVTEEPLEKVALRWRSMGRDVSDPMPANQPGRRIITVRDLEAGLAVISPDSDVQDPGSKIQYRRRLASP